MQRIFQKKDFMELVANTSKTKVDYEDDSIRWHHKYHPAGILNANAKLSNRHGDSAVVS